MALCDLAHRQAVEISDTRYRNDIGLLIAALVDILDDGRNQKNGAPREFAEPIPLPENAVPNESLSDRTGKFVRRNRAIVVSVSLLLLLLIAAGGSLLWKATHRAPSLTHTIVLADFANTTEQKVFDDTLNSGLRAQLLRSPLWTVLSEDKIARQLKYMGRPGDAQLTKELAREICERTGSTALVTGSIAGLGGHYVIGLTAENCSNGDLLGAKQVETDSKEHLLQALGQLVKSFRGELGDSLTSLKELNEPLAEATTPSLEALEAYTNGRRIQDEQGSPEAIPHYERAVSWIQTLPWPTQLWVRPTAM